MSYCSLAKAELELRSAFGPDEPVFLFLPELSELAPHVCVFPQTELKLVLLLPECKKNTLHALALKTGAGYKLLVVDYSNMENG